MKKLKKSVKALIISGVAIICAVALTLGLVFGLKKDGDTPGGNNPGGGNPVSKNYVLTNAQSDLVEEILLAQAAKQPLVKTDYSKFVDENGTAVAVDKITQIEDEYFVANDTDGNQTIYFMGASESVDMLKAMVSQDVIESTYSEAKINSIRENYVHLSYSYTASTVEHKVNAVVYIADKENIVVLEKADFVVESGTDRLFNGTNPVDSISVQLFADYYLFTVEYLHMTGEPFEAVEKRICAYTTDTLEATEKQTLTFNKENVSFATSNSVLAVYENAQDDKFYYVSNGDVKSKTFEETSGDTYTYTLINGGIFIQTEKRVEETTPNALHIPEGNDGYYVVYEYEYFSTDTEETQTIELENGFVYATLRFTPGVNGFALYEQKIENSSLVAGGKVVYFDVNGNKVISYSVKNGFAAIKYSNGTNILTEEGIISTENKVDAEYIFNFVQTDKTYVLRQSSFEEDNFVVSSDGGRYFYIMNIDGTFVFNKTFADMSLIYGNDYLINNEDDGKIVVDATAKTETQITNLFEDATNNMLLDSYGYYLVENDSVKTLKNVFNDEVVNNVTNFEFLTYGSIKVLKVQTSTQTYYYTAKVVLGDGVVETPGPAPNPEPVPEPETYSLLDNYGTENYVKIKDNVEVIATSSKVTVYYDNAYYPTEIVLNFSGGFACGAQFKISGNTLVLDGTGWQCTGYGVGIYTPSVGIGGGTRIYVTFTVSSGSFSSFSTTQTNSSFKPTFSVGYGYSNFYYYNISSSSTSFASSYTRSSYYSYN